MRLPSGKAIAAFVAVLLMAFVFFSILQQGESPPKRHTCIFYNQTLDLFCSGELRVLEEYDVVDNKSTYSQGSYSNIREIYESQYVAVGDTLEYAETQEFFSDWFLSYYRVIHVVDVETGENFVFYVGSSGEYDVEIDNTFRQAVEICRANENTVCLPDQHWRCWNYDRTAKNCDYLAKDLIQSGEQPIELCYELIKGDLVAYCLSKNNLSMCYDFASAYPAYAKICDLENCLKGRTTADYSSRSVCYEEYGGYSQYAEGE